MLLNPTESPVLLWHGLQIDFDAGTVRRGGRAAALTPREFALLAVLLQRHDCVLTRAELLQAAWHYDIPGRSRTVDVHISRLRRKLGLGDVIQTVYRQGYCLYLDTE